MKNIDRDYTKYYQQRRVDKLYPTEFVLRAFLGSYPKLSPISIDPKNNKVLDLGYGDGRNIPFLHNLGLNTFGVEITEEINERFRAFLSDTDIDCKLAVGRNCALPYEDGFFDHVVACHSCYYVDEGTTFKDNLKEIKRVLKSGGRFVFSIPTKTSYLIKGAEALPNNHARITSDPLGVRKGTIVKFFESKQEIFDSFDTDFTDIRLAKALNSWWGIDEHSWIGVATKK